MGTQISSSILSKFEAYSYFFISLYIAVFLSCSASVCEAQLRLCVNYLGKFYCRTFVCLLMACLFNCHIVEFFRAASNLRCIYKCF